MELILPERRVFGPVACALAAFMWSAAANAQTRAPSSPVVFGAPQTVAQPIAMPDPNDPAAMLSSNLKILASNPYDVDALLNAGLGAIAVGDPNAAIGFLARAEELSPRNGRVKAALGSALVMVERPVEALRMFADAQALGVPEIQLAKDRGLAWDLRGDQARAQRDYALALKLKRDDEVTRRYAMSLGISGEKDSALRLLDPLVRRGDQAAWRARAFVLAMNGDIVEAEKIVRTVVPPQMVGSMTSFLGRLPALPAAQRALAVNFGSIPAAGVAATSQPVPADAGDFRPVNTMSTAVLLPTTAPVRTIPANQALIKETARERRKREKREKELAVLAAKNRKSEPRVTAMPRTTVLPPATSVASPSVKIATASPAPVPVIKPEAATTVPKPNVFEAPDTRVGKRVGEVDPSRLPPVVRDIVKPEPNVVTQTPKVTILEGTRTLPAPSAVAPAVSQPVSAPSVQAPKVSTEPVIPASIATVPAVQPAVSSISNPAPTLAKTPAPSPASEVKVVLPAPDPVAPGFSLPAGHVAKVAEKPVEIVAPSASAPLASVSPNLPATPLPTAAPKLPDPVDLAPKPPVVTAGPAPQVITPDVGPAKVEIAATPKAEVTTTPVPPAPEVVIPVAVPPQSANVSISTPAPTTTFKPLPQSLPAQSQPAQVTPEAQPVAPITPEVIKADNNVETAPGAEAAPQGLGAVLSGIEPEPETDAGQLPTDAEFKARQLAAKRKEDAEAKAKADAKAQALADEKEKQRLADAKEREASETAKKKEEAEAEARKSPSRIWVQIATGANKSGLPITWRKLKADAPKSLEGQSAWFSPFRATNRLLIGPFKSTSEARAMVNKLGKEGVAATTWTSEQGQDVAKLGGK